MLDLNIPASASTPSIAYDEAEHTLRIHGVSYPENARLFYKPLAEWLGQMLKQPGGELFLDIRLEYLNSSSAGVFYWLFSQLEGAIGRGMRIRVDWRYHAENELMEEAGNDFRFNLTVPFVLIKD